MADRQIVFGATSNILRAKLLRVDTGQGLTGLTLASSGLIISTICDNEAAATAYTESGATIETIATLGTFEAPTATKCRFKEVDATNHPGTYEIQIDDARFAVTNAKVLRVSILGVTNLREHEFLVELTTAADIADKILGRNLAGGEDGTRTVQDALRVLRNKVVIDPVGDTITVYAEDDTTPAWTGTIIKTASVNPITTVDPA
jgi:hypothetical protein